MSTHFDVVNLFVNFSAHKLAEVWLSLPDA